MKLKKLINNFEKKLNRLNRLNPHLPTFHVPSSNNRTGLSHWKGKPIIALKDWIQICGQLPSRLEYFPDDFDQALTYMELPYYRHEFERKKRRLEAKRRQDGWLNDEVGSGTICHDSIGNLVNGLGNPIKEAEEVVEEYKEQDRDEELIFSLTVLSTSIEGVNSKPVTPFSGTGKSFDPPRSDWKLDTTGMNPCGYVIYLVVWDLPILAEVGYNHYIETDVGFCLEPNG